MKIWGIKDHVRSSINEFESSQPLLLYGANGRVCAIPTYRVYRLYDNLLLYMHSLSICCWNFIQAFYLQERYYVSLETARANAVSLDWKSFAAGK